MLVGVPKEIKTREYRVAVTPDGAAELVRAGHGVLVEEGAGEGSGFQDHEYAMVGAIVASRQKVFADAALIVKVKEPLPAEYPLMKKGQMLFTYLHLAPNPELLSALRKAGVDAYAYETLESGGRLPLLEPMSEIAGRMAPLMGAYFLQRPRGGRGVLPTGVPGVPQAHAVVIGAGIVGGNAVRVAHSLGMRVTLLNKGIERLREIEHAYEGEVETLPSNESTLARAVAEADMVIGAVLVTGARAPRLITKPMLRTMRKGAVVVDVSIDQGGCFETSRPTTHDSPVYRVSGIVHYCVANMPGAYPRTSTLALTNVTLPYVLRLASLGAVAARSDAALKSALNVSRGEVVHPALLG